MPLGASRLAFLAKTAAAAGGRTASTIGVFCDAQVDTARSVFGGASLLLDGTGDYLTADPGNTGDFIFAGGDPFTFEFWFNYDNDTGSASANLLSNKDTGSNDVTNFFILFRNFDTKLQVYCTSSFSIAAATGAITADTWNHVALVRNSSNNLGFFLNGSRQQYNSSITGAVGKTGEEKIGIGALTAGDIPFNQGGNGWIDEVRVSSVARYDPTLTSLTVPTSSFANDDDTLLLLHMDGSDTSTTFEDDTA